MNLMLRVVLKPRTDLWTNVHRYIIHISYSPKAIPAPFIPPLHRKTILPANTGTQPPLWHHRKDP